MFTSVKNISRKNYKRKKIMFSKILSYKNSLFKKYVIKLLSSAGEEFARKTEFTKKSRFACVVTSKVKNIYAISYVLATSTGF